MKLTKNDLTSKLVEKIQYRSLVGSLLYASMATRPDVAEAVGMVSRFCECPTEAHLTASKRVLAYLKSTPRMGIIYGTDQEYAELRGYSYAIWASDIDDRRSVSANLFIMAGGAVSWTSKRQGVVALSTAEAEYMALSSAAQEALWLRELLEDLRYPQSDAMITYEDNQGAIAA